MGIVEKLKDSLGNLIVEAIDKKIDGKEIAFKLEEAIEKQLSEKGSEKIQRGALTNLLLEIVDGFWAETPVELTEFMNKRYNVGG